MKKIIGKTFFKLMGWKLDITVPVQSISKCVLVAAPHTTNWDFFYAIFSFWSMEIPMKFFIKDSWTKPWYGFLIKAVGGIGINRTQSSNKVEYAAELLQNSDNLYMLNTPEGSRSWVEKWKTGFYYIALEAKVPILLSYCDYEKKMAGIGRVIKLENRTKEEVLLEIQDFYKDIKGKYPEDYNPKIF
ncbi:MAG: 1-acyl-sn-glycerol-3-phosphate acyltransferase [Moheibacter sp.]